MGLSGLISRLLPGGSLSGGQPAAEPSSPESEAWRVADLELEAMVQNLIRSVLASGEASIIRNDPDAAERLAGEMGVTIPAEALRAAREARDARYARAETVKDPLPAGYPLAWSYERERFRELGTEAAGIIQRFARYGGDFEAEHRDGIRLLTISKELAYGSEPLEWQPGTPRDLVDPDYPWPELAWLPGYLVHIGREMVREAEPHLKARQ